MYLIEVAQEEIKEINRKNLFQKAEIRKKIMERDNEASIKIKKHFIETSEQYLNNSLSIMLLELKEKVLELKNNLIDELKKDVYSLIEEKINKNYSNYVNFLIDAITNQSNIIDKPPKIILLFNSKDYKYFTKNPSKLKKLFKTPVEIKNSSDEMIGGFKAILSGGNINYDYSINNLIEKNTSLIQKKFSKIISDSEIKEIEEKFEVFIKTQKLGITEYLKDYERI